MRLHRVDKTDLWFYSGYGAIEAWKSTRVKQAQAEQHWLYLVRHLQSPAWSFMTHFLGFIYLLIIRDGHHLDTSGKNPKTVCCFLLSLKQKSKQMLFFFLLYITNAVLLSNNYFIDINICPPPFFPTVKEYRVLTVKVYFSLVLERTNPSPTELEKMTLRDPPLVGWKGNLWCT